MTPQILVASLVAGGLAVACSDSDDDQFAQGEDLFLVFYTNQTPDGITSFVAAVPDLTATSTIRAAATLEISGFIGLLGPATRDGTFFVAPSDTPRIDRYRVGEDGVLAADGSLSYEGLGSSQGNFMLRPNHFLRDDEAFFVVPAALKIAIWNPQEMVLDGEIDLEGFLPDSSDLSPRIIDSQIQDERLLITAGYFDQNNNATSTTRLAVVDLATRVVTYSENTQCGFPTLSVRDTDDNVYFIAHPLLGAGFAAGVTSFPPCMIRLNKGEDTLDSTFFVDMTSLTGRPTASVVQAPNGLAYVTISPREPSDFTPDNFNTLRFAGEWEVYVFDPRDPANTASKVDSAPPTADQIFAGVVEVDGSDGRPVPTPVVNISTTDFTQTTVYDVSDPDAWVAGLRVPGYIYNIVRSR